MVNAVNYTTGKFRKNTFMTRDVPDQLCLSRFRSC
jgi:hypothetical protein